MDDVIHEVIYAKIDQIMNSDNLINLIVTKEDKNKFNLKLEPQKAVGVYVGCIYKIEMARYTNSDKQSGYVLNISSVNDIEDIILRNNIFRKFMNGSKLDYIELKKGIEGYINKIGNKILKDITIDIISKYENDFYLYPAATKLHHAYVGGLAYHTLGMLNLVDGLVANYPYINKDYMYSGIILHDIGKVIEFSGVENTEYAPEGQLLGHLLIGCNEIKAAAIRLGYDESEEVFMLLHMVASHHGQPLYGAIKKPATAEAALLWYIDTIDSKFRVLGEELEKTEVGHFTDIIGVMDKTKFYKHK